MPRECGNARTRCVGLSYTTIATTAIVSCLTKIFTSECVCVPRCIYFFFFFLYWIDNPPVIYGARFSRSVGVAVMQAAGMANLDKLKAILRSADGITFDVDSTVIQEEGIDELAKFCGKGDDVAALTKKAMQGSMSFRESLGIRLSIIQPSQSQIKEFIRSRPARLTPGIKTLVKTIQDQNKQVFLVSGGFHCLILPVAAQLNIPSENIYANKLKFFFNGDYAGFDGNQPTSRSGGKCDVIKELKELRPLKTVVHIGDGATDLEASPPADTFIGYGGNVIREDVKAKAAWFITDFNELVQVLTE